MKYSRQPSQSRAPPSFRLFDLSDAPCNFQPSAQRHQPFSGSSIVLIGQSIRTAYQRNCLLPHTHTEAAAQQLFQISEISHNAQRNVMTHWDLLRRFDKRDRLLSRL